MADIFMSYSSKDRPRAEALAAALAQRGWSVWWDRKIVAGNAYDDSIEHELDSAKCAVVLWSHDSVTSEWVKNEAAEAVERGVLVPVMIDNVRLPLEFRRKQTVDLTGWDGTPSHAALGPLVDSIAGRIAAPSTTAAETHEEAPVAARVVAGTNRRHIAIGAATVVVLIAAAAGGFRALTRNEAASGAVESSGENYAMTCRSGGPFNIRDEKSGGVRIGFTRASAPASVPMQPGQCSWSDRVLNPNEPEAICDDTKRAGDLVNQLSKRDTDVIVQVHYEAKTHCFRVVHF